MVYVVYGSLQLVSPINPYVGDLLTFEATVTRDWLDAMSTDTETFLYYRRTTTTAWKYLTKLTMINGCYPALGNNVCWGAGGVPGITCGNPPLPECIIDITFPEVEVLADGTFEFAAVDASDKSAFLTGTLDIDQYATTEVEILVDPQKPCNYGDRYCNTITKTYWNCEGGQWIDTGTSCVPTNGNGENGDWMSQLMPYAPWLILGAGIVLFASKRGKKKTPSVISLSKGAAAPTGAPVIMPIYPYPPTYPMQYQPQAQYQPPPPPPQDDWGWEPEPQRRRSSSRRRKKPQSGKGLNKSQCLSIRGMEWVAGKQGVRKGYCRKR